MMTNHLIPEELSALLDGALAGRALERAEGHLADCAACRNALAALSAQEETLKRVLVHDPGEAYFTGFADRVGNRIRAEGLAGAQQRGAAERPRAGAGLGSPRSLAWLGAVATVVVGVGIVFLTTRETNVVPLRDTRAIERATQAAPPTPAPEAKAVMGREASGAGAKQKSAEASAPEAERGLRKANESGAREKLESSPSVAAPPAPAAARMGRAQEVRRDERGEDVPVNPPSGPAALFARPPAPAPAPAAPGEPVYVKKHAPALPMAPVSPTTADNLREAAGAPPAAAPGAAAPSGSAVSDVIVDKDAAGLRVCGNVHDPSGRPVANASVMLVENGATATTDARGRFCVAGLAGERTLTVLAVGFEPARQTVSVRGGAPEVSLALKPVAVLGGAAWKGGLGYRSPAPGAPDLLSGVPDSLKGQVRTARLLSSAAAGFRSAAAWEAAAEPWARIVAAQPGGAAEAEARFQLASARFHAWEISPSPERRSAAARAIAGYLAGAGAGARREQARAWQERVGR